MINEVVASDEQLVDLATRGSDEAFNEIVRRWERKIFALCWGLLGAEQEARDAAQESFISAYRNLKNFRRESKFSSWLHKIAVNQCLTRKRRAKTRNETLLDDANENDSFFTSAEPQPIEEVEQKERFKNVHRAVAALPVELKQVVMMKEFEEMTFQEIADALGLPISTVKSRLYTALKQLRMKLEKMPMEIV